MDDSLRSPCGRSMRHALLSGLHRGDGSGVVQKLLNLLVPAGISLYLCRHEMDT
jgi:hypothetical protein